MIKFLFVAILLLLLFGGGAKMVVAGGARSLNAADRLLGSGDGAQLLIADQPYGRGPRQSLDVWGPEGTQAGDRLPVVIFFYGGGWNSGDRESYGFAGRALAQQGFLTIIPDYRLTPRAQWPDFLMDSAAAVAWVREHAPAIGGDPDRIALMGHSAGAAHVVNYAVFEDLQLETDGVAGMILVSGPTYDSANLNPFVDLAYYGMDESAWPAMSVIEALDGRKIPALLAYAEFDMDSIHTQNRAMIDALTARDGRLPAVYTALGHNHISITAAINTGDEGLSGTILEFITLNPARQ